MLFAYKYNVFKDLFPNIYFNDAIFLSVDQMYKKFQYLKIVSCHRFLPYGSLEQGNSVKEEKK